MAAAKAYFDELMPKVGFVQYISNDDAFSYRPGDWQGVQVFFYPSLEPGPYSRHGVGLQHLCFWVPERSIVRDVRTWVSARGDEVVHAPREFPEYGSHYATFWLDPHGFMLEAFCHKPEA